jgi:hypothetical protein
MPVMDAGKIMAGWREAVTGRADTSPLRCHELTVASVKLRDQLIECYLLSNKKTILGVDPPNDRMSAKP